MTDHSALIERLEGKPGDCPFCGRDPYHYVDNGVGMERVAVICCDEGIALFQHGDPVLTEQVSLRREAAACIREMVEVENDAIQKREGLEEDLYQAVLVAYRLGAVEWTMLNYPQWINAISAGREVCPLPSAPNQAKEGGE